ncbi:lycopene cyclase domain-containing protein [Halobacteria archaeon AArc-m2/3/4]|uniref:Lycopene cyclase domain-containing protein n=1 Tax=Natronoglomus mannanivorans TaxID=2979990 RepID=A0AAP2YWJ5_9EURY|nr:lycopene cyclase domain-containing protein [Halobacteria archaeon AArc-xg1-1]MCU4971650.1 lycopene cyclase domain-containing protein [Halobacteria archaeon AArc-m2/3/4]
MTPGNDSSSGSGPKIDIAILGRYTYLATEIFWGAIAFALLRRAGALRRAAVTILALYPIAYVWDRYTLAVGVFDIKLRTGIEVAGIPLEEHLFMAVVPGLVIGMHETMFGTGDDDTHDRSDTR